jgi:hypothetical protein
VVRDEDDFNPKDDDLLDEDDQAKDQDTEDMDESKPNRGNGQNSDEQPQPTDEFIGMTPTKQAALVEEAIDMACDRLIEELSYIVMNEPDDDVEIVRVYLVGYTFCIIDYHICRDIFGRLDIMYCRLSYVSRGTLPLKTLVLYIYRPRGTM